MGKNLRGKELGACLSQRKDGRYSARFVTACGKRVEKYFESYQDARKWLAEARLHDGYGTTELMSIGLSVDKWFEYWIVNIKGKSVRPNTIRNYRDRYRFNIQKHLGKKLLVDVRPMHCQIVLNDMAEGYAGSTIQQTLITLYNLFQCAFENGLIISNPVTRTVKLPKPVVENTRVLTVDDQEKFLAQAKNSTNYPQYFFILNTGVRTGEMIGLKWEDIDFDRGIISIRRTMEYRYSTQEWRIGPPKTKNGYRDIPITKECRKMLMELKSKLELGKFVEDEYRDFVFINSKGMPTKNSTYDAHLEKLTKKAGIDKFSMHTLRHTFATRCIEAGMRPKTLQQILGHSNINITMNLYVHVTEEENLRRYKN
ncbi:MAG: site-specific integrase [Lachnospiraceae bacterium]|nr:site-specific integrase [Lachnospiraceae bacterium]